MLVIGFTAFLYRQQVAQAWPRSASLYAALGLKVNPVGIDFMDVTHSRETEDGQSVLAIRGKLINVGSRRVAVPPIELVLQDASNHEVLRKSFRVAATELQPGQVMPFLARLSSPPAGARRLNLRFAKP